MNEKQSNYLKRTAQALCLTTLVAALVTTCPQIQKQQHDHKTQRPMAGKGKHPGKPGQQPGQGDGDEQDAVPRLRGKKGDYMHPPHHLDSDHPMAHLLAAKGLQFKMEQPKDVLYAGGTDEHKERYLDLSANEEKNHKFGLRRAKPGSVLEFNRETSYILPKGVLKYGSHSKNAFSFDQPKPTKALILLDTSGSMCGNQENFRQYTLNNQTMKLYLPAILSLGISNFYINGLHTEVAGFTFSSQSEATPFTRDLEVLANHFTKRECSGTVIDYALLREVFKSTNANLDVYILSDDDIFSEKEMRMNIQKLQEIKENNTLRRTFFIEWKARPPSMPMGGASPFMYGPGGQPMLEQKDHILAETGMENTYYGQLTSFDDIGKLVDDLNKKVGR